MPHQLPGQRLDRRDEGQRPHRLPRDPPGELATVKLMDSGSPFAVLVQNFEWTNEDQNQVALDIESGMSPEAVAKKWIDAHPDIVAQWLKQKGLG